MLERLELRDVGPAPSMRLDLAPRLNVFAGDNGVGKTFVLDVTWWALTGSWAGYDAAPHRGENARPAIWGTSRWQDQVHTNPWSFSFEEQRWATGPGHEDQALVIYARVDGGFSIHDRLRDRGNRLSPEALRPARGFHFTPAEVWDGLFIEGHEKLSLCNGLVRDWAIWQLQRGHAFETLTRVLEGLSPHPGETIRPGTATARISIDDVRDIPTIELPYATIPVVYASAGMKRILGLAYMLVWMWREHIEAAKLKNTAPSTSLMVLFDEIESHLHPQWQRVLLPALLRVVRELSPRIDVQILATTHAPLVLASLEPHFDEAKDALFHFDVDGKQVTVSKVPWRARGDASAWLTSDVFDLGEARSVEAERAIAAAKALMLQPNLPIDEVRRIHHDLHEVLKDTDPFWPRWLVRARQAGVEP